MTDTGYDFIIKQIEEIRITPPEGLTTTELEHWILGWSNAYSIIISLIQSIKKGNEQR